MKEVTKERKSLYTVFEAVDGTEFYTKEECAVYEASAKGGSATRSIDLLERRGYVG